MPCLVDTDIVTLGNINGVKRETDMTQYIHITEQPLPRYQQTWQRHVPTFVALV